VAGFASLALTPIPPVQVFGSFIAIGVMVAWVTTLTFIPAALMLIPEKQLATIGHSDGAHADASPLGASLLAMGRFAVRHAKPVVAVLVGCAALSGYGLSLIQINDNPTKWFSTSHPIRIADRVLNEHFGGTYMAYLVMEPGTEQPTLADYITDLNKRLVQRRQELLDHEMDASSVFDTLQKEIDRQGAVLDSRKSLLDRLDALAAERIDSASDQDYPLWDEAQLFIEQERQLDQVFKQPEVLRYLSDLQEHLKQTHIVGKSNSLADIVKTVHRELLLGEEQAFRIPDTSNAVAQTLLTFQNGHRPDDLWHLVTPDYRKTSLWLQLVSGDNRDMSAVVRAVDEFTAMNPPPANLNHDWFGLTYINVIWQDKMVSGMVQSFLGSFLVVLFMMILLYRSALWGLLAMIPLTITVGIIYGIIGFIGKDYDMPVAVLSSLSLGLAVDYAIHFLTRTRMAVAETGSWQAAVQGVFGEPARAIARNAIVVSTGFLPLLAANLIPYQTVGIFIAAILMLAGLTSLWILPALVTLLEPWLFPRSRRVELTCNCGTCVIAGITLVGVVAINMHQFLHTGWRPLSTFGLAAVIVLSASCVILSRRQACRTPNA
ncbi:MAG: efflux RND transporter permease subunit, partial [Gammaproteobacteria bacterium]